MYQGLNLHGWREEICTGPGSRVCKLKTQIRFAGGRAALEQCTWLVMEADRPWLMISSYSSMLYAMPPPVPPSVNAGRMISGKRPIFLCTCADHRQGAESIQPRKRKVSQHHFHFPTCPGQTLHTGACLQTFWLLLGFDTAPQNSLYAAVRRKPDKTTSAAKGFPLVFTLCRNACVPQQGTKCVAVQRPKQLCRQDLADCRLQHLHFMLHYLDSV